MVPFQMEPYDLLVLFKEYLPEIFINTLLIKINKEMVLY